MNQQHTTAALCLDLSKAFDMVNHQRLLAKMEKYGIRGVALTLMKNYLTNRTQRTISRSKDGEIKTSKLKQVESGVPQGSILGPLLYILYTNDLVQTTDNDMVMFADDTTIVCEAEDGKECQLNLENDMKNINKWVSNNNLMLNLKKTKLLLFRGRNDQVNLKHQDTKIETVFSTPFLGIIIDRNLGWKDQIDKTATTIARHCYALRIVRDTVGTDAALTSYHAYIHSTIRYGIIFWARSTESERIFRLQKRCIRVIFGMRQMETCRTVFKNHGILTLYSMYIYESVIFVINNISEFKNLEHPYNTRGKNYLIEEKANFTYLQRNVTYSLLAIWNKLPENFKNRTLNAQKSGLKRFLMKKCYYSVDEFLQDSNFEEL